jgi:hypothetical protein
MATLQAAEAARESNGKRLRRLGAHAIEVRAVKRKRRKTFIVIAHFEREPKRPLPNSLQLTVNGRDERVELVIKVSPPFQLE